jgi:uncharacterized membrane protein
MKNWVVLVAILIMAHVQILAQEIGAYVGGATVNLDVCRESMRFLESDQT